MGLNENRSLDDHANESNSLRNIKKTKKIAAGICIILSLVLSYLLYSTEYHYTFDKSELTMGIADFIAPFGPVHDPYVLETETVGNTLIASFKDRANADNYGIAVFALGFNNRYRIIQTQMQNADYSSVVQCYPLEIRNKKYYVVSGYHLSDEIGFYGLDYLDYFYPEKETRQTIRFAVQNSQFLEIYLAEELDEQAVGKIKMASYRYLLHATSLYDASGNEITEKFRNVGEPVDSSSSAGKVELFLIYIYMAIIIILGVVLARYFLTVSRKEN